MNWTRILTLITLCFLVGCSTTIYLKPDAKGIGKLKVGDELKIRRYADERVYRIKIIKIDNDSLYSAERNIKINEITYIEKQEISFVKSLLLYQGIGLILVFLSFAIFGIE